MFENIAAFDIGTSSIKVATVKTGFKDFQVRSFAYENIDQDNESVDDAINEALRRIVEEMNLQDFLILTNLPMEKAIIRDITFPFKDKDKMAEAIPFEAEENIPFRLEDIVLDFLTVDIEDDQQGRVLLAAAHKESIQDFLGTLEEFNIKPAMLGLESQALFESYRYFNKIEEESIFQVHIGNNKTIINIIQNNKLLYTRSISIGVNLIYKSITGINKGSFTEAVTLFENLNLDLSSYDNNLQRDYYKTYGITKKTLKKLYEKSLDIIYELVEQILLSKKSFLLNFEGIEFSRILISGGGANIIGIGSILSREFELPVVSLPFLQDNNEPKLQTQFPIAFGTVLAYLNKKQRAVNLLKGEFVPDIVSTSRKKYYLAASFGLLTIIILIINIISTTYLKSQSNSKYNEILNERLKKYFHTRQVSGDPIKEAMKILKEERKEFDSIDALIHSDKKVIDKFKDLLSFFPKDDSFKLKNMVINESIIKINGSIGSSKNIDEFKNKLTDSKMFDNVTLNTNIRKGNEVSFSMTIKQKISKKAKKADKKK